MAVDSSRSSAVGLARLAGFAALAAGILGAAVARADVAGAEALFQQGRELLAQGRTAEACDRFAESQRLDASSGTLINLASCHETLGKTASAWAEFLAAARLALAQSRPDRAEEAERRAAALVPRLSRLTISASAPPPALVVLRDDTEVGALDVAIPVDPGSHTIRASAPGYEPWTTTIELTTDGEQKRVEVPRLVRTPPVPVTTSPKQPPPFLAVPVEHPAHDAHPSRPLPLGFWASAGTTVAAAGVGTVFGVLSLNSYSTASSACPEHVNCDEGALSARDRAEIQANVANVAFATALAAAGVATWLFFAR